MTEIPPPPPPPGPYAARLEVDRPDQLDRVTTLLRLVWIVPIVIILALVSASVGGTVIDQAGEQVRTTGIAVTTGLAIATALMIAVRQKYPRWWFDWNRELLRFSNRVCVFLGLMDDRYPSTDEHQSVHLEIDYPDVPRDLNRWLPLAKWLLAVPHYVVLILLYVAALVCVVIAWLAVLLTGRYTRGRIGDRDVPVPPVLAQARADLAPILYEPGVLTRAGYVDDEEKPHPKWSPL
jgi:hypothetical protein